MSVTVVIPARLGSVRLPKKMLLPLAGKSVIEHVYSRVKKAKSIDKIYIATESQEIYDHCSSFGAEVIMTSDKHLSGTARIGEAVKNIKTDFVINVQGDEIFIDEQAIDLLAKSFTKTEHLLTAGCYSTDEELINSANSAKIVTDLNGYALYFSRSPIPFYRANIEKKYLIHIGIYGYSKEFLMGYENLKPGIYEPIESLEQLRVLENGLKIKILIHNKPGKFAIDTIEDFNRAKELIENNK